jgi:hypothetical protein
MYATECLSTLTSHTEPISLLAVVTMPIIDYPTTTEDALEALYHLQSTHTVQLMQARDMDGKLIMPADYGAALRGACAWVRFTLEKFSFRVDNNRMRDTFVADIVTVNVITKPEIVVDTPQPSPKKRKVMPNRDPLAAHRASKKGKGRA